MIRALLVLALIGCGGAPAPAPAPAPAAPHVSAEPATPSPARPRRSCEVGGEHHRDGATIPEDDRCQTCRCEDGVRTACVRSICDAPLVQMFEFLNDEDELDADADAALDVVAQIMLVRPELVVVAVGSAAAGETDPIALSQRRARAVVAALVSRGVAATRLADAGKGYSGNASHLRRVELVAGANPTPEILTRLLGAQHGPYRCHRRALKGDPFLTLDHAEITVTLTPEGPVEDLAVEDLDEPDLERCLALALSKCLWPPVSERTTVAFTLPLG